MPEPLFMYRIPLDLRRLASLERRLKLPAFAEDTGYLVHCQLKGLFGELAPQPFAIDRMESRSIEILAYGRTEADELRQHADTYADPAAHQGCDWSGLSCKKMPDSWPHDHKLGFEVRVCPVVRRASSGPRNERAGREMDAFLAQVEQEPEARHNRYKVYVEWLGQTLDRLGGARLETARVDSFRLQRLLRRNAQRQSTLVPPQRPTDRGASGRPDATLKGVLRITDTDCFRQLLARGVGRHRAFGFGMLLLKPVTPWP